MVYCLVLAKKWRRISKLKQHAYNGSRYWTAPSLANNPGYELKCVNRWWQYSNAIQWRRRRGSRSCRGGRIKLKKLSTAKASFVAAVGSKSGWKPFHSVCCCRHSLYLEERSCNIMPRTMQTAKRKASGPPPRKQSASSYMTTIMLDWMIAT